MSWVGVAVAAGTAIYGGVKQAKAKKEARKLAANRPVAEESPYTRDELQLTKANLANGMSGEAVNAYEQAGDRDLSNSLNTILMGGGDVNNVAELFDRSQAGRTRLLLMRENLRMNNVNNYVNSLRNSTGEEQMRFKYNEVAPWADQAQANAAARQQGEQMMFSGITSAASGIAGELANANRAREYNNYFNTIPSSQAPSYSDVSNINPSAVTQNNGMSVMANATPYINPNYANNPFNNASQIDFNNFSFDPNEIY